MALHRKQFCVWYFFKTVWTFQDVLHSDRFYRGWFSWNGAVFHVRLLHHQLDKPAAWVYLNFLTVQLYCKIVEGQNRDRRWNDSKAMLTLIRFSLSYCEGGVKTGWSQWTEQKRERVAVKCRECNREWQAFDFWTHMEHNVCVYITVQLCYIKKGTRETESTGR